MKKLLSATLALCMLLSLFTLAACGRMGSQKLRLGIGVYTATQKATDADGDVNGKGQAASTVAAVLVDRDGKIVKCKLDCADNTVEYTSDGKFVSKSDFKTKNEMGSDYGMKELAGSEKEWFEQADAFCALAVGKDLDTISELAADGGRGNADVIKAGCTIDVSDFIRAIEKAVVAATDSSATDKDELKIKVETALVGKDAAENTDGYSQLNMTFKAFAGEENGENTSREESAEVKFTFDAKGVSTTQG